MVVYKIQNKINNKVYIGITIRNLSKRIASHIVDNKSYVQKALNKYGLESFDISVIDHADTLDVLKEKEKYWIKFYECRAPKGYNCTDGGDGTWGHIVSEKGRQASSKAHKDIPLTENHKGNISKGLKNSEKVKVAGLKRRGKSINKGNKRPDVAEMNRKRKGEKRPWVSEMNKASKGKKHKPFSEETKQRMRKPKLDSSKMGRHERTEEIKNKTRGDKNSSKRPDVREKISQSQMGHTPWNKGLTKETDERVKQYTEKRLKSIGGAQV